MKTLTIAALTVATILLSSGATARTDLVLRCTVDTVPSSAPAGTAPADVVLSADTALPVKPASDANAGLPDAPEDDVANTGISPSVKQGDGPDEVSVDNLDAPHKELTGVDLQVWNQFCRGRNPTEIGAWRLGRCTGLDSAFKK